MSNFLTGVESKYTKELLKNRISIEGNVLGCFFKDMLLLDEVNLTYKDFLTKDGLFYFQLLTTIRKKGFYIFDEVTIRTNINEGQREEFDEKGGYDAIQQMMDIIEVRNFDGYIDNLNRENIMCHMHEDGIDLNHKIDLNGNKISLIKMFRQMESESVIDWWESRISGYDIGYSKTVLEDNEISFDENFLLKCQEGEENGVPFGKAGYDKDGNEINCLPFLSNQINGLLPGTLSMVAGYSSAGKSTFTITILMALLSQGRKVLIISNEENTHKFKVKFMVWLLGKYRRYFHLTKKKLMSGEIEEEDREEYNIVSKYWQENYEGRVRVIHIADANMSNVKKKVREYALREQYDTVFYDTFKIQESDYNSPRQDLSLVRDSRELDKLAKKYNLIVIASIQLAEYTRGKLFLSAEALSNSKQIKEILENLVMMRNVYPEELDPKSKFFCEPFRLIKSDNDPKYHEQPWECDRNAVWRMLFVEKCRSGSNSSDNGRAYLLKYDGDHCIFREFAQCKPRHGEIK